MGRMTPLGANQRQRNLRELEMFGLGITETLALGFIVVVAVVNLADQLIRKK